MDAQASGYPEEIHVILNETCATSGCHNTQSAPGAAGLNLETWDDLFKGSRGGSPVIPYTPEFSYLINSINTDTTLGPILPPTMPLNREALNTHDFYAIWHWINDGCRNIDGEERFPPDPNRRKYYVGHSECDGVAVFDAESRQIMRFIEVGNQPGRVEYVYDIQVTPDGKEWMVVFFNTNVHIERYSTTTDEKIADIPMGDYGWSNISFSPDSKLAFVTNEFRAKFAVVNLQTNQVVDPPLDFRSDTRGPTTHPTRQEVYLTENLSNNVVVWDYDDDGHLNNFREVDLIQGVPPATAGDLWPWEIFFMPDGSKYFVSCSNSDEVRVLDAQTDSLLDVILLPTGPSRMAYSASTGRLFVACMMDNVSWAGEAQKLGSINAINASTHQLESTVYSGYQPYGLTVDDDSGVLVVANRNTDPGGPDPHHESPCGDRNGYLTLIDLNTLTLVDDYKPELLVDPIIVSQK